MSRPPVSLRTIHIILSPTLLIITYFFFFFNDTATTEIYTLSLHDALPISEQPEAEGTVKYAHFTLGGQQFGAMDSARERSEEHTSELQSHSDLVCRLLLEKKKKKKVEKVK